MKNDLEQIEGLLNLGFSLYDAIESLGKIERLDADARMFILANLIDTEEGIYQEIQHNRFFAFSHPTILCQWDLTIAEQLFVWENICRRHKDKEGIHRCLEMFCTVIDESNTEKVHQLVQVSILNSLYSMGRLYSVDKLLDSVGWDFASISTSALIRQCGKFNR